MKPSFQQSGKFLRGFNGFTFASHSPDEKNHCDGAIIEYLAND